MTKADPAAFLTKDEKTALAGIFSTARKPREDYPTEDEIARMMAALIDHPSLVDEILADQACAQAISEGQKRLRTRENTPAAPRQG